MTDNRRAVIYCRISKDRSDETSTSTQERACRDFAASRGWTVVDVQTDRGRSAYKENTSRPGLDRAMMLLGSGAADLLLVWKLDRFVRSITQFVDRWRELEARGANFASVTDNFDTSTGMGQAMLEMAVVFAKLESSIKADRVNAWHAERLRKGASPTGPRPFGYSRAVRGQMEPDLIESAELTRACVALLDGASLSSIVRDLNDRGVPTAGHRTSWHLPTLRKVLVSPTTGGFREVDGVLMPGAWEPAVDPDLWRRTRDLLTDPLRLTSPSNQRRHLLVSGAMTCEACGGSFRHRYGKTWSQPRYVCRGCSMSVPSAPTDDFVSMMVLATISPKTWQRMRKTARAPRADPEALDRELEQLAEEFANTEMTIGEWRTMRQAITDRVAHARKQTVDLPDVDDLHAAWPTLSVQARLLMLDYACESITVTKTGRAGPTYKPQERVKIQWR